MYRLIKNKLRTQSYKYASIKSLYSHLNSMKILVLSATSDSFFSRIVYKAATGEKLNLDNPITFNEKLWWLKINYRHPLMTQCSDKVKVRDYIEDIGLGHILNDIEGVYSKVDDIPFDNLEGKFFIKCNHVSGTNVVYDSNKKHNFDHIDFKKRFNLALSKNYYQQSREWNYKNIKPKIIVEKFIETESELLDYRFFCFHGEAKLIFVDINTAADNGSHNPYAKRNIYDKYFKLQNFTVGRENFDESLVTKPKNLEKMIEYAELIAQPFIFCRVDLYNIKNEIKFGEITFYPGGGTQQFSSEEADLMVSSWLEVL